MSIYKQKGFTLITVMLLTTMASVVVFATLKDTVIQERLSGNFQKDMNARLMSEKGIFDHYEQIRASLANNTAVTLDSLLADFATKSARDSVDVDVLYNSKLVKNSANELEIHSTGSRFSSDANANMIARFEFIPPVFESVFGNAMTGCKAVNLAGSGVVDSYDSSLGTYDQTKTHDGDVDTVVGDADVTLSGHSPIKGDVKASGVIYLKGSSPIIGNIHSNTGVDISPGSGVRVEGNVYSRGFYIQRGGQVTGIVRVNGDASMMWDTKILNQSNDPFAIQYGGKGSFPDTNNQRQSIYDEATSSWTSFPYSHARFKVNPNVESVKVYDSSSPDYDPAKPNKECDPLELPINMPDVMKRASTFTAFKTVSRQLYEFKPSTGRYLRNGSGSRAAFQQSISALSNLQQEQGLSSNNGMLVYGLKGVQITSDSEVFIRGGDVIWLVDGNFEMSGDTRLHITKGSSLTVFITGTVKIGASAKVITEDEGITDSGFASLSFFSSNSSYKGFVFSGASDLYAAVYAPNTEVVLNGSGQLYGTVRGATIDLSGATGVHFDAALKKLKIGGSTKVTQEAKLKFLGWRYQ